jgi:hypothetical protein
MVPEEDSNILDNNLYLFSKGNSIYKYGTTTGTKYFLGSGSLPDFYSYHTVSLHSDPLPGKPFHPDLRGKAALGIENLSPTASRSTC